MREGCERTVQALSEPQNMNIFRAFADDVALINKLRHSLVYASIEAANACVVLQLLLSSNCLPVFKWSKVAASALNQSYLLSMLAWDAMHTCSLLSAG